MISGWTLRRFGAGSFAIAPSARRRQTRCACAKASRSKPPRDAATAHGRSTARRCASAARSQPPRRTGRCRWCCVSNRREVGNSAAASLHELMTKVLIDTPDPSEEQRPYFLVDTTERSFLHSWTRDRAGKQRSGVLTYLVAGAIAYLPMLVAVL